jgi:hypothetical protein
METPARQLSTAHILSAVSHLSVPELEQVFAQVLALQAERKAAHFRQQNPRCSPALIRAYPQRYAHASPVQEPDAKTSQSPTLNTKN